MSIPEISMPEQPTWPMGEQWVRAQMLQYQSQCEEIEGWPSLAERRAATAKRHLWYATMMRIEPTIVFGNSVLDIGGGPDSLTLLPEFGLSRGIVADPLTFLDADEVRYRAADVLHLRMTGEDVRTQMVDEVWVYDCLRYVLDIGRVLETILAHAPKTIRIFEWIDVPLSNLTLHVLSPEMITHPLRAGGYGITGGNMGTCYQREIGPFHGVRYYSAILKRDSRTPRQPRFL